MRGSRVKREDKHRREKFVGQHIAYLTAMCAICGVGGGFISSPRNYEQILEVKMALLSNEREF